MNCKFCEKSTTGNSKYCPEHAAIARQKWVEMIKTQSTERENRYEKFAVVLSEAIEAGQNAFDACVPVPMIVQQHEHVLNDKSPVVEQWVASGGVCGFASVKVRPATCSFARWLVKNGRGSNSDYAHCTYINIRPASRGADCQSYEKNSSWARAFAGVLRERLDIDVHADCRLD